MARLAAIAGLIGLVAGCGTGAPGDEPLEERAGEAALTADCAGLVPALPARLRVTMPDDVQRDCMGPALTGDASGALIPYRTQADFAYNFTWPIFDASTGAQLGAINAVGPQPLPKTVGFEGTAYGVAFPTSTVYATDRQGQAAGATSWTAAPFGPAPFAPDLHQGIDWASGSSVLETGRPQGGQLQVSLQLFDDAARPRGPAVLVAATSADQTQPFDFFTGVDLAGRVLVLYPAYFEGHGTGTLMARWFTRAGAPLTPSFAIGGWRPSVSQDVVDLAPLVGGGFALWKNGAVLRVFPSGKAYSAAPPAWMTAVRGRLRLARGARAYAEMPTAVDADCGERAKIWSPAGNLCGSVRVSASASCSFRKVDLARDGTLMQAHETCQALYWWPRALE